MNNNQIEEFIARYTVTSTIVLVIASIFVSAVIWLIGMYSVDITNIDVFFSYILVLSRYMQNILGLAFSTLFTVISVDAIALSLQRKKKPKKNFMVMVNSKSRMAYIDIAMGNLCLFLFFVAGQIDTWLQEEYYGKFILEHYKNIDIYVPSFYIHILLGISLLLALGKFYLVFQRNKLKKTN